MLNSITLRVSKEELERQNQTSVQLPGGGYMAWLGMSHELHCIVSPRIHNRKRAKHGSDSVKKMLRQWNYRSHYHPDITEEESGHWIVHAGRLAILLLGLSNADLDNM